MSAGVDLALRLLAVVVHGEAVGVKAADADRSPVPLGNPGQNADKILFVGFAVFVPAFVREQTSLGGRGSLSARTGSAAGGAASSRAAVNVANMIRTSQE